MTTPRPHSIPVLAPLLAVLLGQHTAMAQPPSAAPPASTSPAQPTPASTGSITRAEDLLQALETADKGIQTLQAQIKYMRDFGALNAGKTEARTGTLSFRVRPGSSAPSTQPAAQPASPATPRREFVVDFDRLELNGQLREERKTYIFDGEWFVEKDFSQTPKQFNRRRVVPPGQVADPLRIGEGPFPIPIGQRRQDIVSRFSVELLPPGKGFDNDTPPTPELAQTYQLRLIPREGTPEARDYKEVRLWYDRKDLLPRLARTVNSDGGTTEVLLAGVRTNADAKLSDQMFDTTPPPANSGWSVDTKEYRGSTDSPQGTPSTGGGR